MSLDLEKVKPEITEWGGRLGQDKEENRSSDGIHAGSTGELLKSVPSEAGPVCFGSIIGVLDVGLLSPVLSRASIGVPVKFVPRLAPLSGGAKQT